jgi:hypothetical protein
MDNIKKKASSLLSLHFTLNMSTKTNNSLYAEGWRVTTATGASVTIATHDITAGLLERKLSRLYVLQMALGRQPFSCRRCWLS